MRKKRTARRKRKADPAVLQTFDENAETEVFSGVGVMEVDFFFDFRDLYGKMMVESTHKYAPTG